MNDPNRDYSAGDSSDTAIKRNVAICMIGVIVLLALSVMMFFMPTARADDMPKLALNCFVGGSVGTAASANKLSDGVVHLDVGGTGALLSGEVGCYLPVGSLNAIALIRADLQKLASSAIGSTATSDARYMALIGPSIAINTSTNVYGGPLLVLSKVSWKDIQSNTITGYGVGAGVDMDIGKSGLRAFAEYNWITYKSYAVSDITSNPNESIARVGIRLGF